jgi:hypothetical protein
VRRFEHFSSFRFEIVKRKIGGALMLKSKRTKIILCLTFAFIFPLSYTYSCYDIISEADFNFKGQKFEAGDMNDLFLEKQKVLDFAPIASSRILTSELNAFEHFLKQFSYASSQFSPFADLLPILRC